MGLSQEQRAQLKALTQTLQLPDWSSVQHGLALLEATQDAELMAHVRQGVSIQDGRLCIESGYLKRTVTASNLFSAALFLVSRAPFAATIDTLNLSGQSTFADLSPLSRMTGLVHLNVLFTAALDFSVLRSLPSLTSLRLGGALPWSQRKLASNDFSFLSGLTALTHLDLLDVESLLTLDPLKGLTSLTHLDLSGCTKVTDLSPLKGLTALTALNCWGSGVPVAPELDQPRDRFGVPIYVGAQVLYESDLRRVSEVLTHNKDKSRRVLPKIVLDNNQGVQILSLLVVVSMVGQLTTSTQTAAAMIEGRLINSADIAQSKPAPVVQLTPEQQAQVEAVRRGERATLDLRGASLQDLSILSDLTSLTSLNLSKCLFLTDTSGLKGLAGLKELRLSGCKALESLSLEGFTTLHTLSISGCKSLNALSLSGCHALKSVTGLKCAAAP